VNAPRRLPHATTMRLDEPTLARFVLLSLLLHIWLVLLFGTTTGGGARSELAPGDIFDVRLRPRIDESGASLRWTPGTSAATPGSALLPRDRSAGRPAPRAAPVTKPAPETPPPTEGAIERPQPAATPEPAVSEPTESTLPPAEPAAAPPAAEPLQRFNPDAQEMVDKPYVPAPVPAPTPPPPAPVDLVPAPTPVTPEAARAPAERPAAVTPPAVERETAPDREAIPAPARSETPMPQRSELPAEPVPRIDAPPAPPAPPTPAPPLLAPPVPSSAVEHDAQPPLEKLTPRAPTIEPATPSESIANPPARETVPAPAPATPAVTEPVVPREQRSAPSSVPATPLAPAVPSAQPQRGESVPGVPPPRLRFNEPAPDEDMFKPRRDLAPPGEPGSAPKLDLDDAKKRAAREIVREGPGSRGLLSVVPPPPDRESKEARALAKAAKPDCRTAYADMGLLAAVPLVASAIGNTGCRW
jgi:hypothetical protein